VRAHPESSSTPTKSHSVLKFTLGHTRRQLVVRACIRTRQRRRLRCGREQASCRLEMGGRTEEAVDLPAPICHLFAAGRYGLCKGTSVAEPAHRQTVPAQEVADRVLLAQVHRRAQLQHVQDVAEALLAEMAHDYGRTLTDDRHVLVEGQEAA